MYKKVLTVFSILFLCFTVGISAKTVAAKSEKAKVVPAELKFHFTKQANTGSGFMMVFLGGQYLGHLEALKVLDNIEPPANGYPIIKVDYYSPKNTISLIANTNGKTVLQLVFYQDERMIRTEENIKRDLPIVTTNVQSNDFAPMGEKKEYPNSVFPEFGYRLMYQEEIDLDSMPVFEFNLQPEGFLIGSAGKVFFTRSK